LVITGSLIGGRAFRSFRRLAHCCFPPQHIPVSRRSCRTRAPRTTVSPLQPNTLNGQSLRSYATISYHFTGGSFDNSYKIISNRFAACTRPVRNLHSNGRSTVDNICTSVRLAVPIGDRRANWTTNLNIRSLRGTKATARPCQYKSGEFVVFVHKFVITLRVVSVTFIIFLHASPPLQSLWRIQFLTWTYNSLVDSKSIATQTLSCVVSAIFLFAVLFVFRVPFVHSTQADRRTAHTTLVLPEESIGNTVSTLRLIRVCDRRTIRTAESDDRILSFVKNARDNIFRFETFLSDFNDSTSN